jgi:uncharacterized protein YPO0396
MTLANESLFDFITDDAQAGFRLWRFEVYNWGTFHNYVWEIQPEGHNALLTGDIGSGKSTLVDAITTLLVPHHRIVYNKAAGAETKERTLYSYIRGEFKTEKDELTKLAKAIALREEHTYTVILGHFYNQGYEQAITLAQVFWLKDNKRNPERFFVVSELPLTVTEHFSKFGTDINHLKKLLKQRDHIEIFDNFKEYSTRFRQFFGIQNEQALELFYQTVSMKSIGNLTDFVRQHMLEKSNVAKRIEELRKHYDNLNRSHEAVLKAKHQISQLTPIANDIQNHHILKQLDTELRQCRDVLASYFAKYKHTLLIENIALLQHNLTQENDKLEQLKQELQYLHEQEISLKTSIDDNGGKRLRFIDQELDLLERESKHKKNLANDYQSLTVKLGLNTTLKAECFHQNQLTAKQLFTNMEAEQNQLQLAQVDIRIQINDAKKEQQTLEAEIASLKKRNSNIPTQVLSIRQAIAQALDIDEKNVPFVGELLQVDDLSQSWRGAIERLLHNFGLSILVPDALYSQISHYVDRTRLHGRIVYYRIATEKYPQQKNAPESALLINKLQIKPEQQFHAWLKSELENRFNYYCCETLEEFKHYPFAITKNAQIKSGWQRHEKDDRYIISDQSRYILGWSNQDKIAALSKKLEQVQTHGFSLVKQLQQLTSQQENLQKRRDTCRDLLNIKQFSDIDWQTLTLQIQQLLAERAQIEKSSDILKTLKMQLNAIEKKFAEKSALRTTAERKIGSIEQQLQDKKTALDDTTELLQNPLKETYVNRLDEYRQQVLGNSALHLHNLDKAHQEVRKFLEKRIDEQESKITRLNNHIVKNMQIYKSAYPAETLEVDAGLDAAHDYQQMLLALENEDLPRHEQRFKNLLNEGTINSIALFQNQLFKEKEEIEAKIRKINLSLCEIEYNSGTYIELRTDTTQDLEIRDFQESLRRCLTDTLNQKNFYDEEKFLQVKALIGRFNGREDFAEIDRKWTQKVTDVRNWFTFSASERFFSDASEKEFYSDSSGKSGGQKEKLAYTILASALAYQFGLEWNVKRSRSFRFVVIDEAFGKGSDDSTRYALTLFKKLNLQLLIVTPLQKIHIIEDYVRSVHFIDNQGGNNSVIQNMTIVDYREQKRLYDEQVQLTESSANL